MGILGRLFGKREEITAERMGGILFYTIWSPAANKAFEELTSDVDIDTKFEMLYGLMHYRPFIVRSVLRGHLTPEKVDQYMDGFYLSMGELISKMRLGKRFNEDHATHLVTYADAWNSSGPEPSILKECLADAYIKLNDLDNRIDDQELITKIQNQLLNELMILTAVMPKVLKSA